METLSKNVDFQGMERTCIVEICIVFVYDLVYQSEIQKQMQKLAKRLNMEIGVFFPTVTINECY